MILHQPQFAERYLSQGHPQCSCGYLMSRFRFLKISIFSVSFDYFFFRYQRVKFFNFDFKLHQFFLNRNKLRTTLIKIVHCNKKCLIIRQFYLFNSSIKCIIFGIWPFESIYKIFFIFLINHPYFDRFESIIRAKRVNETSIRAFEFESKNKWPKNVRNSFPNSSK